MAADPIEIILQRQWASYIAVPTWITDHEGRLLYFNESIEPIIGMRFEEADELPAADLADRFAMCEVDGTPISNQDRPRAHPTYGRGKFREIKLQPFEGPTETVDDWLQRVRNLYDLSQVIQTRHRAVDGELTLLGLAHLDTSLATTFATDQLLRTLEGDAEVLVDDEHAPRVQG